MNELANYANTKLGTRVELNQFADDDFRVRYLDSDAGEVISIRKFGDHDAAAAYYFKLIRAN